MIRIFKFTAIAEGISYLLLFFNMLIIKPYDIIIYKKLLFPIGMSHGVLFISYVLLAFLIKKSQKWSTKDFFIVQIASLLPFGTFYIERKYLKTN